MYPKNYFGNYEERNAAINSETILILEKELRKDSRNLETCLIFEIL